MRPCRRCGRRLPPHAFTEKAGAQGGRSPICITCEAFKRGPNVSRNDPDGLRTCRRCRLTLPEADFPRNRGGKRGLSAWCKPCMRFRRHERELSSYYHDVKQAKALGLNLQPDQ